MSVHRPPLAVLWDNDGVLVDTEVLFFQATHEVLAHYDIALTEELYVDYVMRNGRSLFELIVERVGGEEGVRPVRARRDARYAELISDGVRVLDGVSEALESLYGRLPMAIVTGSGREHFEQIHRPLGLLRHFEFSLADGDYPRHKPDPAPYLLAAERLGLAPEDCVAVEDSERGLRAAVAAGMRCFVIPRPFSRDGDFKHARRVLSHAGEVPTALAQEGL
jgi:HAD superfamily hydrolase (TIGR01509 family)